MKEPHPDLAALRLELAGIIAAPATLHQRAQEVLDRLGRVVPFDAAWLAVRDPERRGAGRWKASDRNPAGRVSG